MIILNFNLFIYLFEVYSNKYRRIVINLSPIFIFVKVKQIVISYFIVYNILYISWYVNKKY
jgi:hypothetical protein